MSQCQNKRPHLGLCHIPYSFMTAWCDSPHTRRKFIIQSANFFSIIVSSFTNAVMCGRNRSVTEPRHQVLRFMFIKPKYNSLINYKLAHSVTTLTSQGQVKDIKGTKTMWKTWHLRFLETKHADHFKEYSSRVKSKGHPPAQKNRRLVTGYRGKKRTISSISPVSRWAGGLQNPLSLSRSLSKKTNKPNNRTEHIGHSLEK